VIERERKYRLSEADAAALETRLAKIARPLGRERQETIVFRDTIGVLPKGTLIRYREEGGRRELTVKGKKTQVGLDKVRLEWNVELGEGPIVELLGALRIVPNIHYVKDANRFELRGLLISVDRLESLGVFCEIEARDMTSEIDVVAEELGLDREWFEPRGYPSIAAAALLGQPRLVRRNGGPRKTERPAAAGGVTG
jgi:adenylate cyclase class IV